jgi:hypothetical protein
MRAIRFASRPPGGLLRLLAAAGCIAAATSASADPVAFDNFGPGDSYSNAGRWVGTIGPSTTDLASSFVPTQSGEIAALALALVSEYGGANTFTLSIRLDASGPNGALLWQSDFPDAWIAPFGSVLDLSIAGPAVTAGMLYWLVVETDAPTFYTWQSNTTNDTGPIASRLDGGGWAVTPDASRSALRVTLVPEPGTAGLFALGLALLGVRRRDGLAEAVQARRQI